MISKFGTFEYALADRYRFDAELGRGAMGTVYRARDVRLDRPVAIKMLHATLTNGLGVARFQSEIRIAASLHHPNIVSVHDSGEADGRLFYVMDYLGGETLRTRLQREKQLSVDDALLIVEQIAEGLQFAHDRGVVHRDIKPENILLTDGIARVVDFGLARALGDVDTERLTASGLSVGTPQYLSPEQAAAEKEVGPRADQYGLACVLYEMLVGEPPFTGPTATAVAMRHISEVPALLRNRRRTTPASFEAAVARALEKVPADRFGSVKEFAAALSAPVASAASSDDVGAHRRARRLGVPSVMALAVLSVALVGMIGAAVVRLGDPLDNGFRWLTNRSLDTARYAVLPFAVTRNGVGDGLDEKLRDALSAWTGVSAASAAELRSVLGAKSGAALSATDGRAIARAVGAGRYVMGEVTIDGGQQRIRAEALDASGRMTGKSATVSIPIGAAVSDSVVAHLAYQLLYDGDEARRDEGASRGTTNRMAFESFMRGKRWTRTWSLANADSGFAAALRHDPSFPQALLELATVRRWESDQPSDVASLLQRAVAASVKLTLRERSYADAMSDLVNSRFHSACSRLESLLAVDSTDFATWYGLGECNSEDRAVVSDHASASGKSFRASLNRANVAFDRAFSILPTIDSCCIERAMSVWQRPLIVSSTKVFLGTGLPPDTARYGAYPELIADTIALVPRPYSEMASAPPRTHTLAIARMRNMYLSVTARRLAMLPGDAKSLEAFGEAMELQGDAAAIDTIHKARLAAKTLSDTIAFGTIEVWLRLKYALPSERGKIVAIRSFADSLLTLAPRAPQSDAGALASLAVLVGDAGTATQLAARSEIGNRAVLQPTHVSEIGKAYLVLAAMGAPRDSLREVEDRLGHAIANEVVESEQASVRNMLIGQAAGLAYPVYRSAHLDELDARADYLIAAEIAHSRGNNLMVRRILDGAVRNRSNMRPADVTLDAIYPEAWLRSSIGDSTTALDLLAATLDALPGSPARRFEDPAIAGALIQAMILRARLERTKDPRRALLWANAVRALRDREGDGILY